jgi:hypothetical protein
MRRPAFALVLVAAACAAPRDGRAEGYPLQIAAVDGASDAVLAGGAVAETPSLMGIGFLGTLVAAPVVHLTHENEGRAAISLAGRFVAWVAGSTWLYLESTSHGRTELLPVLVMFASVLAVQAADALILAR